MHYFLIYHKISELLFQISNTSYIVLIYWVTSGVHGDVLSDSSGVAMVM